VAPEHRPGGGSAGRVIAGSARGVRLTGAGPETRALGDRVKQVLFAILEPRLRDRRFLDLFAGTGAGGIEALSRGAEVAVFVERDRRAAAAIAANLTTAHLGGRGAVLARDDAIAWLRGTDSARHGPYDAVLVDPPYDRPDLLVAALEALGDRARGLLAGDAIVVAKHFWREAPPREAGLLASFRERRFGETTLTFYRPVGPEETGRGEDEA
jgi:16S rRNA (guanine966-N2)-methyltransferase